jgi:hypothetical protein
MHLDGQAASRSFRYALIAARAGAADRDAGPRRLRRRRPSLLQTGLCLTPEKLKPDWSKALHRQGLQRIFGPDGLMQFVKSLVKVLMTGAIAWWILKPVTCASRPLSALDGRRHPAVLPATILKRLVFAVAALTLPSRRADWLWQRQRSCPHADDPRRRSRRTTSSPKATPTSAPARSRSATSARAGGDDAGGARGHGGDH